MKPRKHPSERLRRLVHVLFNDDDYIRLLEVSSPTGLSEWCRNVIKEAIRRKEAENDDDPHGVGSVAVNE